MSAGGLQDYKATWSDLTSCQRGWWPWMKWERARIWGGANPIRFERPRAYPAWVHGDQHNLLKAITRDVASMQRRIAKDVLEIFESKEGFPRIKDENGRDTARRTWDTGFVHLRMTQQVEQMRADGADRQGLWWAAKERGMASCFSKLRTKVVAGRAPLLEYDDLRDAEGFAIGVPPACGVRLAIGAAYNDALKLGVGASGTQVWLKSSRFGMFALDVTGRAKEEIAEMESAAYAEAAHCDQRWWIRLVFTRMNDKQKPKQPVGKRRRPAGKGGANETDIG